MLLSGGRVWVLSGGRVWVLSGGRVWVLLNLFRGSQVWMQADVKCGCVDSGWCEVRMCGCRLV